MLAESGDVVIVHLRTRTDHDVIISHRFVVLDQDKVGIEVEPFHFRLDEIDVMGLVDRAHIERDILFFAESERIPYERREEEKLVGIGDHRYIVVVAYQFLEFDRSGISGEVRANDGYLFAFH